MEQHWMVGMINFKIRIPVFRCLKLAYNDMRAISLYMCVPIYRETLDTQSKHNLSILDH